MKHNFDQIPISKLVLRLGIPAMLAQFFNILYSIVDRIFVGNIPVTGDLALASIGVCAPALTAISATSYLVGVGGGSLFSMSLGKKDEESARKVISQSFQMLLVLSVIVTVLSMVFKRDLLYLLGCSDVMYPYADRYYTIYVTGTIASLLSLGMNQFILAQGFARQGMISVVLGALTNLILDPIFINGLGMGIAGAALATVISQFCSMTYVMYFLFSKQNPFHIKRCAPDWEMIRKITSIGFVPFLILLFDNLMVIFLNACLRRYGGATLGDMYISAAAIVQSFMVLICCPAQGITTGCSTLYSYHYGAGNYKKLMQAFRSVFLLCAAFITVLFFLAQLCPSVFVRLFTSNPEMIALTSGFIRKYTIGLLGIAVQYALVDGLTAMGKVSFSLPVSFFRKTIYLVCIFILPLIAPLEDVFYCGTISDIIGATFSAVLFFVFIRKRLKQELMPDAC